MRYRSFLPCVVPANTPILRSISHVDMELGPAETANYCNLIEIPVTRGNSSAIYSSLDCNLESVLRKVSDCCIDLIYRLQGLLSIHFKESLTSL